MSDRAPPRSGDIVCGEERLSRREFEARAARGAGALRAMGATPGGRVACLLRNEISFLELCRAAMLGEAVLVPVNWHAAAPEVAYTLDDCGAEVVVVHRDLIEAIAPALAGRKVVAVTPGPALRAAYGIGEAAASARPDLPEWAGLRDAAAPAPPGGRVYPIMRYTSGSTGRPKGIRREPKDPDRDSWDVYRSFGPEFFRLRPGGVFYTSAPLYHSGPGTLTAMALAADGMSIVVAPRFDAEAMLADIASHGVTHCYIVPTMMVRLLKLPEEVRRAAKVDTLEFCFSTGSPWPHEVKAAMIDWWGPVMFESYGASEIGYMTLVGPEEALARPGTAGRMQMGGEARILDPEGRPLPPGEIGVIYVKYDAFGDFDYTSDPEGRVKAEKDGFLTVGDMGWMDADGYLYIADRAKDMIISGGANIFPAEIEAALIEAPFVADCAVFGAPDPEFGETVVAAVQPAPGCAPTEAEVRGWLEGRIARFKIPRKVDFHDALPREDSGKVFKPRLRASYWEGSGRRI